MPCPARLLPAAAVALLMLAGCGVVGREPGEELCDALGSDLESAVTASKELEDVSSEQPMRYGTCRLTKTKRLDVDVAGIKRDEEVTIIGELAMDPTLKLWRLKDAAEKVPANRVTALPRLGPEALVVVQPGSRERHEVDVSGVTPQQGPTGAAGPANAHSLRVTAYWQHGRAVFSASGTRDGATVEESIRITERLAELINRRPVEDSVQ